MQAKRVGWIVEENVPWLGPPRGWTLRRDHWLAGRAEEGLVRSVVGRLFPGVPQGFPPSPILLHRQPGPNGEYGVEVFASAARLGVMYWDGGVWRLVPSGALASLLESRGAPVVELGRRGRLKGKRVELGECPGTPYVLVASGRHVGPARVLGGDPCTARVRDMAPRGFHVLEDSDWIRAARANRAYLERLAAEAREFIVREAGGETLYVAVSGGLDSSVTLLLAVEALGPERVRAVYADTGMEFPESRRTAMELADRLGVELDVVSSGRDPLGEIRRRGLMSRDDRWCTRILKLEPLRRYYRSRGARVVADGARALESDSRARTPRSGVNPLIPGVRRILPIHSWSRLEVQLYAVLRGIPMNPLYHRGLQRIGCIVCPAMHLHELETAMELEPGFYERLYRVLRDRGVRDPRGFLLEGSWMRRRRGG